MYIKVKYLPTAEFEKLKARLVAGCNLQDKKLYDDLSAPTVSTCSVLAIISVAVHEKRSPVVVDITGAYLNADMDTGITVHMSLDQTMSDIITKFNPKYFQFMNPKGRTIFELNKTLYECVVSASLWNENIGL